MNFVISGAVASFVMCNNSIIIVLLNYCHYYYVLTFMQGIYCCILETGARGGVVVKALRYKPAGRGFDSRWCHWNFSVT